MTDLPLNSKQHDDLRAETLGHLRPLIHFTAPKNWINDPNGLVYYEGEYHLFYQHHPYDDRWGPMHWGHAVSQDLVNWQHLPIALSPDEKGYIFSGSAVIDWHNCAGFGQEAMIAFFTHHLPHTKSESQSLAFSLDQGRSWTKYANNPIIPALEEYPDFRDPKVSWYDAGDDKGHWVMLLAAGHVILIYTSDNLIDWQMASLFDVGHKRQNGVLETPDLFQLPIDESSESRWVLTVGIGDGAPVDRIRTEYFVGQFDGHTFTNHNINGSALVADYGADFYAAQSWNNEPHGRRLWIGWMNNMMYAHDTPSKSWRGVISLPRQVGLIKTTEGVRMVQSPVEELKKLRDGYNAWHDIVIDSESVWEPPVNGELVEIVAQFELTSSCEQFGIRVQVNEEQYTAVGYKLKEQSLFFDRTSSGHTEFHPDFSKMHRVTYAPTEDLICFHLYVDRSVVELFVDDGAVAFGERVFPNKGADGIQIYCMNGSVKLKKVEIFNLKPANFSLFDTAV